MITYITHMRVNMENAAMLEAAIAEMTARVHQHEPGVLHYALSRSSDDPELYVMVEIYRDEAAFKAHWETDFIRPMLARTAPLMQQGSVETRRYASP